MTLEEIYAHLSMNSYFLDPEKYITVIMDTQFDDILASLKKYADTEKENCKQEETSETQHKSKPLQWDEIELAGMKGVNDKVFKL